MLKSYVSSIMVVLNSKDRSKIVWLPEILCFKNQPCNKLYPKKPAGMHWLGYNDAVSWINEVKTRIFQPTANFENFKIYLYFVCQPASLPAIRPGCTRCRASETSHDKSNGGGFTKMLLRKRFSYPLHHGDSFYPSFSFLFFFIP